MAAELTLTVLRRPDGSTVLRARGEIDMGNAEEFAAALHAATPDATAPPLLVDLGAVEYLDSAALSILFARADRIELVANPLLEPLLTVSGLAGLVPVRAAGALGADGRTDGPGGDPDDDPDDGRNDGRNDDAP